MERRASKGTQASTSKKVFIWLQNATDNSLLGTALLPLFSQNLTPEGNQTQAVSPSLSWEILKVAYRASNALTFMGQMVRNTEVEEEAKQLLPC